MRSLESFHPKNTPTKDRIHELTSHFLIRVMRILHGWNMTMSFFPFEDEREWWNRQIHEWSMAHDTLEWYTYLDRIFRLEWDLSLSQDTPSTKESWVKREYFMEQRTANCFLMSTLNALRHNRFFLLSLAERLEYFPGEKRKNWRWGYTFPDGQYTEISYTDLRNEYYTLLSEREHAGNHSKEKTKERRDIRMDRREVPFSSEEKEDIVQRLAYEVVEYSKWGKTRITEGDGIPPYPYHENTYQDEYGREGIRYTKALLKGIRSSIEQRSWPYYDLAVRILWARTYRPVHAPLWYKILEALYLKYKNYWSRKWMSETRWDPMKVLEAFLGTQSWSISTLSPTKVFDSIVILEVLKRMKTGECILVCGIEASHDFPHFQFQWNEFTFRHAYSILSYDTENTLLELVNPLNNTTHSIAFSDFIQIFRYVFIAEKKKDL